MVNEEARRVTLVSSHVPTCASLAEEWHACPLVHDDCVPTTVRTRGYPASLGLATTYLARRRDAAGCVQTQRLQQANETSKHSSMRSAVEWHETT